jgi:hypothetical protein
MFFKKRTNIGFQKRNDNTLLKDIIVLFKVKKRQQT